MPTLLLPPRITDDSVKLWRAAGAAGWETLRLDRWAAPAGISPEALMSNATVVPAYIQGTRPFSGMVRDFLQFDHVTLCFGPPIRFDDLAPRQRDNDARDVALKRIMDGIAALRDTCDERPVPLLKGPA